MRAGRVAALVDKIAQYKSKGHIHLWLMVWIELNDSIRVDRHYLSFGDTKEVNFIFNHLIGTDHKDKIQAAVIIPGRNNVN